MCPLSGQVMDLKGTAQEPHQLKEQQTQNHAPGMSG